MPQPKNNLLRTVVPIAAVIAGLGLVFAVYRNTSTQKPATTPPAPTPVTAPATAATQPAAPAAAGQPPTSVATGQPAGQPAGQTPAQPSTQPSASPPAAVIPPGLLDGLRPQIFAADTPAPQPLGSLDDASDDRFRIDFTPSGAGISGLKLSRYYDTIRKQNHVQIQSEHSIDMGGGRTVSTAPFAMTFAQISSPGSGTSATVNLFWDQAGPIWRQVAPDKPGAFEAFILNGAGDKVLKLERTYRFQAGQHDILLDQKITNLTAAPLVVQLTQFGPVDLPNDSSGYGGDKRRVRFGYLLSPAADPTRQVVVSSEFIIPRDKELGSRDKLTRVFEPTRQSWPRPESEENKYELVWAGLTDRYFGIAVFPQINFAAPQPTKALANIERIDRLALDPGAPAKANERRDVMALNLISTPFTIAAGGSADYNLALYAGPLLKRAILTDPLTKSAGLEGLIVYNFGGMCGPCTFTFITGFLIWLLRFLHDFIVFDWAIAIIVLVFCVRGMLHRVTRWSQIRIQRFSKQMQSIQPKQKKLQEKYKDDRQKLQAETAKLWKEEGINPAGMLGCIPMVLQTPVWIALYATLYFAVELRQQPAFFGVFQKISPTWSFLGDLAEPDHLIYFGKSYWIPMLSSMFGPVSAINILPIILGVVFFAHQKYLTPPMANLTPEQETQQKMIKWMSVLMFPLFMYNAPSGLAIYFIANSTLGIFENMWIRKDIDRLGLADPEKMRAERMAKIAKRGGTGGGGWLSRLQQLAEAQRAAAEKRGRQAHKGK